MQIDIISTDKEFLSLGDIWNSILSKSRCKYPFLTHEWMTSWWAAFGKNRELFILLAKECDDSPPHGIAPLCRHKEMKFTVLEFIGTGKSDYLDFIISENEEETVDAFLRALNKYKKNWDVILLKNLILEGGYITHIERLVKSNQMIPYKKIDSYSPFLSIKHEWEEFLSTKSSNFRYYLKRNEKRLNNAQFEYSIARLKPGELTRNTFDELRLVEKNSWKYKSKASRLQESNTAKFYWEFLNKISGKGWLNLWTLRINGKTEAYSIDFDFNDILWFYNSAFNNKFRKYALGSYLLQNIIRDAYDTRRKEYDFLRGKEHFKLRWSSGIRSSYRLVLFRRNFISILCCFYLVVLKKSGLRVMNRLRKNIFKKSISKHV